METPPRMKELLFTPAVFAVNENYQIMVMAYSEIIFWVTVGDKNYYDHSNGTVSSLNPVHRVNVPIEELDKAGEYTVHYRRVFDRKAYWPVIDPEESQTFKFRGIPKEGPIKICHIADPHGRYAKTAQTSKYFGEDLDLLILNGDILADTKHMKNFELTFQLCEAGTGGARPCVFSRGNHDIRGKYSEKLADYTPTDRGNSYYTFRLGRLWGIVLDVGEDKLDDHPVYNGTNAGRQFREEQTKFLNNVIKNADEEYNAPGVEYRIIVSHVAFCRQKDDPVFNPDPDIFTYWCDKAKEEIKPHVMLCGHFHVAKIYDIGSEIDVLGQPCPVVVCSYEIQDEKGKPLSFVGGAYTLEDNHMKVQYVNSEHESLEQHIIDFNA